MVHFNLVADHRLRLLVEERHLLRCTVVSSMIKSRQVLTTDKVSLFSEYLSHADILDRL